MTDVTNAAVYTAANTPTAPSTPFLNGASGVTTCGVVADTSVVVSSIASALLPLIPRYYFSLVKRCLTEHFN